MKTTTWYELWISYGHDKWFNLKRDYAEYDRAKEIAARIVSEHKPTTKVAVITCILKKETSDILRGSRLEDKAKFYGHCKLCGGKRINKNINKDGICISCAMRKAAA